MSILQLKVEDKGRKLAWRPGRGGPWSSAGEKIQHGGLTVYLSSGDGGVKVKVFSGKQPKSLVREVIRKSGTYIVGAKRVDKI